MRLRDINFARLNHVFIPETKAARDRARRSIPGRILAPGFWLASALTREGRAFIGLLCLIGAAGLDVGQSQVYVLFVLATGAVLGSFAARPLYRATRARIAVSAPVRVVENEPVTFGIEIENQGDAVIGPLRVEGPFLPWDGRWERRNMTVDRLDPEERVRVSLSARFLARGEHHLDAFTFARLTPLALVQGRAVQSADLRFMVLPRPAQVTSLLLPPLRTHDRSATRPRERAGDSELVSVRPYRFGDPLRRLHVRTWARTGVPHVKEFRDETETELWLVFECAGAKEKMFEAALRLAAGIVVHLGRQGIRLDGVVAGGRSLELPRDATAAEGAALDVLAALPASQRATDARALLATLARVPCAVAVTADGATHAAALRALPNLQRTITVVARAEAAASPDEVASARVEKQERISL